MIKLDESFLDKTLTRAETDDFIGSNRELISQVLQGHYGMSDALGWFNVAENTGEAVLETICPMADKIQREADVFILAGVGGSNRAAQSVIEALGHNRREKSHILYAGDTLSAQAMGDMVDSLKGNNVYANVIAKNFATLEPGIAFRLLRSWMAEEYGNNYVSHLVLTGSHGKGQLSEIAKNYGFSFLEFPAAVGGRFSAFTTVGLFPMAVIGVDIRRFIAGAAACEKELKADSLGGTAARYAAIRYLLQRQGFMAENLAVFEPRLEKLGRWWLQLHGETEGKNGNAILPFLTSYSEDLHAIGQYIQEGGRFLFETLLDFYYKTDIVIPSSDFDDGFFYLDEKSADCLNPAVAAATAKAHYEDGIPVLRFSAEKIDEETLGEFMYMQMLSSYFSAAFLGVEPFNQDGVEQYKRNLQIELRKS
jgi:glucose-6-phosphate isomerase